MRDFQIVSVQQHPIFARSGCRAELSLRTDLGIATSTLLKNGCGNHLGSIHGAAAAEKTSEDRKKRGTGLEKEKAGQ